MPSAAATESSWARSAKLTEFDRLKEAGKRLERSSKEQVTPRNSPQFCTQF